MKQLTIGILGGLGPEATVSIFEKIIKNTKAKCDQDHLKIIIYNNPKTPDRTNAFLYRGESPLHDLENGMKALKILGTDFIIIPCVTSHIFIEEIPKHKYLPILSIIESTSQYIKKEHPKIKKVGLLASDGTIKSRIFQDHLESEGFKVIIPDEDNQKKVMESIYLIKSGNGDQVWCYLQRAAVALMNNGAEAIIAGCTEIGLVQNQSFLSVPYIDCLEILARRAISYAGGTLIKEKCNKS